ncbi:exo-alpha-sialidase [Parapedobacter composti]|nr:exo-alpha-sialidase [Parapedobacter composti]
MKRIGKQGKRSFGVGLLMIMLQFFACNEKGKESPRHDDEEDKTIEIQVGTRTVQTNRVTSSGTPVVPMWKAPMATVDLRNGAGFPILSEAEHAVVWQPAAREDGAYNHYACLIHHKGRFYAMWGNHELGEDAPGQRVLYAWSDTWGSWTVPEELFPAPGPVQPRTESGIHLKPDRWAVIDDELYAITYVHGAGVYPIARSVGENGKLGEPFLVENLPSNGALPIYMQGSDAPTTAPPIGVRLYNWYRENNHISWWAGAAWGVQRRAVDGQSLIESFIYRAKDGGLVLMLRDWGTPSNPVHNNRMYVSFNDGTGGWATPHPTDIPDSPSRAQGITLDDGTVLLIGNQNTNRFDQALYLDRDPMTISVSKDGYTFDKVYTLRTNSPTGYRFSGVGGRNLGYAYSSSIVLDGWLYTLYSIGKEEMGITRVPLSALEL